MTTRYFAYGSNMSEDVFVARIGGTSLGRGCLPGYRLAFDLPSQRWTGFAANIRHDEGHQVWGRVWEISTTALTRLDEYEAAYDRIEVAIGLDGCGEQPLTAISYTVRPERLAPAEGSPTEVYRGHMLDGARECGLPDTHLAAITAA